MEVKQQVSSKETKSLYRIVKAKHSPADNSRNAEEIVIPTEETETTLKVN